MSVNPVDSAILGDLYATPAMRALFADRARLALMLEFEVALARVEARLGIVPAEAAAAIAAAVDVDRLDLAAIAASTRVVGYPVVGLVAELGRLAGPDAARWLHWGATTQDVLDTALALQLRAGLALIRAEVAAVARALVARAVEHRFTPMAGRTHLQHALPVTFGFKCAVWAAPLLDDLARLDALAPRAARLQFAGAAGTLASLGARGRAVAEGLATELGLALADAPWHATRDVPAEAASVLAIACGNLAKFATDVVLLMQTEIGEVFEPHAEGRGRSSTMPQKRNPIASEYVIACARGVHALAPLMLGAMAGDHERSTGPWQSEALALPQIFALTSGALAHARAIAEGITVDAARMRRNLDLTGGRIVAEAVMLELGRALGREAAHHAVGRACAAALASGRQLAAVLAEDPGVARHLDAAALARLTEPANYLGECAAVVDRVAARAGATLG